MDKLLFSILLLPTMCLTLDPPNTTKNFVYGQYKYNTSINVLVSNDTEQILDFYEDSEEWLSFPTRVSVSTNSTVPLDHPLFVTATQQKGISSWELPVVVQADSSNILYNNMARTLCPHDAGPDIKSELRPTLHITTQNPRNTSVEVLLQRVTDFYVEVNTSISVNVTPSTPQYFYFSFDKNPWNVTGPRIKGLPIFNYTIPKSIILIIDSDDDLCATVSIQNNTCPVLDDEREILYQGYHLTMTTKGGITLTQSKFPLGFYVVFVVKESDAECTGASETANVSQQYGAGRLANQQRLKSFRFRVIATISYKEYLVGALVILVLVVLVAAFVLLAAVPFHNMREEVVAETEPAPSTSRVVEEPAAVDGEPAADTVPIVAHDHNEEGAWRLTVARMTRAPPETLARRSDRYFWGALTVAVVYALPVVQLLFTYQQMVFETGNQDLCYYNFLCAHPLDALSLSDFNHVFSNVAYVALGAVFMLRVRARQRHCRERQGKGIPQHYGLLYSMGLALCMEGFLSACYHLCPNKMNFQFDSSFMYVIAVLVMIKLYQNRHSDLIPSAHSTFMLLALIMTIGLVGILFPSVPFSVFFTTLHLLTCLVLTLKIYYAGHFKMELRVLRQACASARAAAWRALVPTHTARAVLLALANVANWTFAAYTAYSRNKDFARQLLAILMGNAILYTWFYACMKLVHRERPRAHAVLYFVAAHAAWFAALHLFIHGNTRWSETPALSRRRNAECSVLELFDSHDLWHVASAAAMFLSFNLLLTADDDRLHVPHEDIATF